MAKYSIYIDIDKRDNIIFILSVMDFWWQTQILFFSSINLVGLLVEDGDLHWLGKDFLGGFTLMVKHPLLIEVGLMSQKENLCNTWR